jgi:hypothetical protein
LFLPRIEQINPYFCTYYKVRSKDFSLKAKKVTLDIVKLGFIAKIFLKKIDSIFLPLFFYTSNNFLALFLRI